MSKQRVTTSVVAFVTALLFLVFIFLYSWHQFTPDIITEQQIVTGNIKVGETYFNVEIADTPEKRTRGLSNKQSLGTNEGLLFVFEEPGIHGFWMKDMLFSIDIIWINREKTVVQVTKDVTPESYPEIFYPSEPALFVLEVEANQSASIQIGDKLSFVEN